MKWPSSIFGNGKRETPGLLCLQDTLDALGPNGDMGRRIADVPVANIVGTAGRPFDFDQEFRLLNPTLQERWERLARAVEEGLEPPPVKLVQLGEIYFVLDGHHRVSVARSLGRVVVTADVHRICTIAFAKACIRSAHLASKAAEREFLRRIPLPEELRRELWLEEPAQWMRLADAAEAWGLRWVLERGGPADRCQLAGRWWSQEVEPVLERLRGSGVGLGLRDVQLYATALAVRDRLGRPRWPDDLPELMEANVSASATDGSSERPTVRAGSRA